MPAKPGAVAVLLDGAPTFQEVHLGGVLEVQAVAHETFGDELDRLQVRVSRRRPGRLVERPGAEHERAVHAGVLALARAEHVEVREHVGERDQRSAFGLRLPLGARVHALADARELLEVELARVAAQRLDEGAPRDGVLGGD